MVTPMFSLRALRLRAQLDRFLDGSGQSNRELRQGFRLLTTVFPEPRLAASGIRALLVPLGQLGHEAKAASSGRT
jgi:hypothetical protein